MPIALKELHDEQSFPLKALTIQTVFPPEDELADARLTAAGHGTEMEVFRCGPLLVSSLCVYQFAQSNKLG